MTAIAALQKQIERYRQMTGEQRLKVALDLHEMSCNIPTRVKATWKTFSAPALNFSMPDERTGIAQELKLTSELERLLNGEIKPEHT